MLLCKRPDKPDGFDDAVKDAKDKIQKHIDAGNNETPEEKFDDVWREFTDYFSRQQCVRCGYCDVVTSTCPGDLDHFRPKAKVSELSDDRERWGHEIDGTARVKRHRPNKESPSGYWWLAYDWNNYVYACERCNRQWKCTLFPVLEGDARQWPPQQEGPEETPLLLHCYGTENPSKHLLFDDDDLGSVKAVEGSRHGWETIKTCGLDRQTLRTKRLTIVPHVYELVREISDHGFGLPAGKTAMRKLVAMGHPKRDMPGIVRIIAEQLFDEPWEQIEKYAL